MKAEANQNYCHSLVNDEAIEDLKGDGVEDSDDECQVQRQWNHSVDQQQHLHNNAS